MPIESVIVDDPKTADSPAKPPTKPPNPPASTEATPSIPAGTPSAGKSPPKRTPVPVGRSKGDGAAGRDAVRTPAQAPGQTTAPGSAAQTTLPLPSAVPSALSSVMPRHFPKPPRFKTTPEEFFKYWRALPDECLDRSMVYVYRTWPVLNWYNILSLEEAEQVRLKQRTITTNIDKPNAPFESPDWQSEILHRYGSGNYHFKLNDIGIKGNNQFPHKNICMCDVTGVRDSDHPPVIGDLRLIDMGDPDNQSYIQHLRMKGVRLPGDPAGGGEDDMAGATAEVLGKAMDTISDLSNRAATAAAKAEQLNKDKVAQPNTDVQATAGVRAVELVAEAANKGNKIAMDMLAQVQAAQGKREDPLEFHKTVMEAAGKLTPAPAQQDGGVKEVLMLMMNMQTENFKMMMGQMEARLAFTEKMLAEERAARTAMATAGNLQQPGGGAPGTQSANGVGTAIDPRRPKTFIEQLKEVAQAKDALGSLFNMGDGTPADMPGWVPYALQGLGMITTGVMNYQYNAAVAKTGMGQPQAPPDLNAEPREPGQTGDTENQAQNQTGDGGAGWPKQQAKADGTGGGDMLDAGKKFLERLQQPLADALSRNMPGYEFAGHLIVAEGTMAYDYLVEQGKDRVLQLLQQNPVVWQLVMTNPKRFDKFLDEFLNAEMAMQAAEIIRAQVQGQSQAQTGKPVLVAEHKAKPKGSGAGGRTVVMPDGSQVTTAPAPAPGPEPGHGSNPHRAPVVDAKASPAD
jgi:hypothetical protein